MSSYWQKNAASAVTEVSYPRRGHAAYSGEPVKIRARMAPGPATILITSRNREGLDVKLQEAKLEVK